MTAAADVLTEKEEISQAPPIEKNYRQLRNSEKKVFPKEEPYIWLPNAKWSALKSYTYE